ncbi:MAG: hypothetical protein LBQ49_00520, partial [Rickettsiales bacterium]|nr:hypothetical protein [Rickettsiales bacterium]
AARVREKEISAKKLYRYIWLVRKKNTGNGVGDTMTTLKAEGLGRPVPAEQPPGSAMRPNESAAEFFCREMLKTVQHC